MAENSYCRAPDESEYEFIYRLGRQKEQIGTWEDIAEICNRELGLEYTESRYRKMYHSFEKMMSAAADNPSTTLREQMWQLERDRKKIQTEKVEWNRWQRTVARDEMLAEQIIDAIQKLPPLEVPEMTQRTPVGDKQCILCFGDAHYGPEFVIHGLHGEVLNQYSPEIFESRMWDLLAQTVSICVKEGVNSLHVYDMGDGVDGILRVSQLIKLRYGVVDATVHYASFLANWLNELTKHGLCVTFQMAQGANHSQLRLLGQPKGSFANENMDKVMLAILRARLDSSPMFQLVENPTGYIFDHIAGFTVLGIHGEVKSVTQAMKDFSHTYKTPIDLLITGHKHHSMSETVGLCRDVVGVPSIMGIDDFAMSIQATSSAGATMLVLQENVGKTIEYNIKLQ